LGLWASASGSRAATISSLSRGRRHRYEIVLCWSDEDQAYIAEVPELKWCAADGKTYQEALGNVEVVIAEWIETAKEKGWAIPEPKGRRLASAQG